MQCLVHQDTLFNDAQVGTNMREAWEYEDSKDEMNLVLQGLEQRFWEGTEEGWMGCYDFPGGTWVGDGSTHEESWGKVMHKEVSAFNDPVATLWFEWVERLLFL